MWRGHDAGGALARVRRERRRRAGTATSSSPRPGHPGLLALALPWEGPRRARPADGRGRATSSPLIAVTRDGGEGRVTLTRAGRVRLDYRLDAAGVATLRHALVAMARLARAAGADRDRRRRDAAGLVHRDRRRDRRRGRRAFAAFEAALARVRLRARTAATVFSAHQMGSVRMGADPATHPCDPWGRVRVGARAATRRSAASTSATGRSSRRRSGSTR